jgi:hypothetical protein
VVPHVPVCMYAHVREGSMHIAERVKKKTGTNWDRDQAGCANEAVGSLQIRVRATRRTRSTHENKRISGFLWPFLGNSKKERRCTSDMI